jgi:hypothetical protein
MMVVPVLNVMCDICRHGSGVQSPFAIDEVNDTTDTEQEAIDRHDRCALDTFTACRNILEGNVCTVTGNVADLPIHSNLRMEQSKLLPQPTSRTGGSSHMASPSLHAEPQDASSFSARVWALNLGLPHHCRETEPEALRGLCRNMLQQRNEARLVGSQLQRRVMWLERDVEALGMCTRLL